MTDKTAFEKWWERSRFENSAMNGEYLEAQEIWNAAIDAAISKCVPSDNFGMHATDLDVCRAEIQKLRSE